MKQIEKYDAAIIGSGRGGVKLTAALAQAGWKVALVEREHVGGTCVNRGCMPTKTMVASARIAHLARRAADFGVQTGPVSVDMAVVKQRKEAIVTMFRNKGQGIAEMFGGVNLLMGEASFTAINTLEVRLNDGSVRHLRADHIILDTGGRPRKPLIPGIERIATLDSTTILELDTIPDHLMVIGGGYIGLEFAQMFRRFGSQVTIIQHGPQLLVREDPDVAAMVKEILQEDGIEVLLNANTEKAEPDESNSIRLSVTSPEGDHTLNGSHVLLATGRAPNSDRLNLEVTGVETDKHGFIRVNERLETNVPGIYAMGDVKGGPAFTHISDADHRLLAANLVMGGNMSTNLRLVPYTIFIDPELGRIGLTETEARAQGRNIRVAQLPMKYADRALEMAETRGFMKAIINDDTDEILGAAILSVQGGEIMTVLQVAMMGKLPYTAIRDGIFAHPTLAESLNDLFKLMDMPMPMDTM
jgi:pyruvate/2-oxoglutarate dehydrogenase complex dihydrolipoamide dehydrogenase (E3) component